MSMKQSYITFILFVFLAFFSKAQEENYEIKLSRDLKDSLLIKTLVNNTYWTQWGPFSTVSEFAEIQFMENSTFLFKRGKETRHKSERDSIIYESYSGIWNIKDSIITMSRLHNTLGSIESQLKIVNYKELMIINFGIVMDYTKTFIRKPYMI